MEDLLQPLIRGDRRAETLLRDPGQLRRRLLAEGPEALGRALELRARRGVGEGEQPEHEPDHDRIDAGLLHRDPHGGSDDKAQDPVADACGACDEEGGEDRDADDQGSRLDVLGVEHRDHDQRHDVVDDGDRQHEGA